MRHMLQDNMADMIFDAKEAYPEYLNDRLSVMRERDPTVR